MTWTKPVTGFGTSINAKILSHAWVPNAAGNVVIVTSFGSFTATAITLTDTRNWTWQDFVPFYAPGGLGSQRSWFAVVPDTVSNTITVTTTDTQTWIAIVIDEFHSNVASPSIAKDGTEGKNSGSSPVTTSMTFLTDHSLIYSVFSDSWSGAAWSGWAAGSADTAGEGCQYKLDGGTAGLVSTLITGLSGNTIVTISALKETGAALPPAPGTIGQFDTGLRAEGVF